MKKQEYRIIREELKKVLKARKMTYLELARRLGVSESGIKKMLTGNDLSINKISNILGAAGIGITDFFQTLTDETPTEIKLTEKQETFFLNNPGYYHFFYQLLNADMEWKKIKKEHGLTQASIEQYLTKLDRLGLIELRPDNEVRSKYGKNNRITFGNKLAKKVVDARHLALLDFAHIPNDAFRGRKQLSQGLLKMKISTAKEFNVSIRNLVSEFMTRSKRESVVEPDESLEEIGFLFVVTPTKGMKSEPITNLS